MEDEGREAFTQLHDGLATSTGGEGLIMEIRLGNGICMPEYVAWLDPSDGFRSE